MNAQKKWISLVARVFLGSVFLYASWDKILHPYIFSANIAAYEILPNLTLRIASITIAWLEIMCGTFLVLGVWTRASAVLVGVLLFTFSTAMVSAMARGLDISCGCFEAGASGDNVGWPRVMEDILMLGGALWIIKFPDSPWSVCSGEKR